jgi:C1A family cysteine protease
VVALFLVNPLLAFAMSDSEESNLKAIQTAIDDTGANWTVGETSVSGFAWEEKKKLCGLKGFPEVEEGAKTELRSYPSTFDWRDVSGTDWTTTIKDQGPCGSCWAFGSLAAMEAQNNIEEGNPSIDMDLSEQFLLSCSPGSCDGWYISRTLNWLRDTGTVDEACFPYQADDTIPCRDVCPNWQDRTWKIEDWGWVSPSTSNIKGYLLEAPLPTGMTVYLDFYFYHKGVYEHVWGPPLGGHLVTLVGWDDTNSSWICKNSWGEDWGEDGWFRIKYGECGIEYDTAYLVDVYHVPAPTVSIYTDKTNYTTGDTMHVGLNITNPGDARAVSARIGLEKLDGNTVWFINVSSVTLPAELDYSNPDLKAFTLPNIPTGTYTWHAMLDDPATNLIICEDIASWEFIPAVAGRRTFQKHWNTLPLLTDFGECAKYDIADE